MPTNNILIPFLLPHIFHISKTLDKHVFRQIIMPELASVMIVEDPYQVRLLLLKDIELMVKLATKDQVEKRNLYSLHNGFNHLFFLDILPLVFSSFKHPRTEIILAVLKIVPTIVPFLDYQQFKANILPNIQVPLVFFFLFLIHT